MFGQNTLAGIILEDLCGSFPKCIHHSAVSAARFQSGLRPPFISSLLRFLFVSFSLVHFLRLLPNSRPSTLHNTHEHYIQCSLSLSSESSVFLFSSSTSLRACNAAVILVRFWYSRPPLLPHLFFLHRHIVTRPFSGSSTNSRVSGPPCDAGFSWFFICL